MNDKLVKQQPIAANDNIPRPREFDARLEAYLPGLRKLARKLRRDRDEREELLNETVAVVLSRWKTFREDGGFWMWIALTMRSINAELYKRERRRGATVDLDALHNDVALSLSAHQETEVDARKIGTNIAGRNGDILIRRVQGDKLDEIATDYGISKERVRQIAEHERKRVLKVVGFDAAA